MRGAPRRRKAAGTIAVGAVLLIGAVVGFIVVPEHKPGSMLAGRDQFGNCQAIGQTGNTCHQVATGLSRKVYDALRVTTWALLIVGMLVVVIGLINYARREVPAGWPPR